MVRNSEMKPVKVQFLSQEKREKIYIDEEIVYNLAELK